MGADFLVTAPSMDDVEPLAWVHVQAWREAYGEFSPERFYDDSARERRCAMWSRLLTDEDASDRVRVARHGPCIVGFALRGFAALDEDHPPARDEQLYALYILAPWYGKGVGLALLDQCLSGRPALLWVAKNNSRARRFYEKNGVADDGTEKVDQEVDGLAEIRMVR